MLSSRVFGLFDVVERRCSVLPSLAEPADVAHITFATDNFMAGKLIGQWAKAQLGDDAANAKIAFLDLNPSEISATRSAGFIPVSLGKRVLRTETAATAALAIVQSGLGDLG